jgi:CDP-paratose 2-epimerase
LASLPVEAANGAFQPQPVSLHGFSERGIGEEFSTAPPISLYGVAKLSSEQLALEYGAAFQFPVFVNRCGVLAGAGQFGKADQGIFSYWVHSWLAGKPLRYIGFGGSGYQVRDCLHPRDLVPVLRLQMSRSASAPVVNLGGGMQQHMSLRQLSEWCSVRFGPREIMADAISRPYDLPWVVMDCRKAAEIWGWAPQISLLQILEEIAEHAVAHPDWLERVGG